MDPLVEIRASISPNSRREALIRDVRRGLTTVPKQLRSIWFYDELGSKLFDEITRLPEYYPTRAERSILIERAREIVELSGADTLVELGSGTSEKARLLLDAMLEAGSLAHFVPFDVSEQMLRATAIEVSRKYEVRVTAVVGDFDRDLTAIPRGGHRLVAFLGGTIGNLGPRERHRLFFDLEATMAHDDWLLLGTDLEKDVQRLVSAYDDAAGVTAEFNRNVLAVLNRELSADFDLSAFDHVALWNADDRWIEMRLRSLRDQTVKIKDLDLSVEFKAQEDLLTEISAKFTKERVEQELAESNFIVERAWTDCDGEFLVSLARPRC